MKILRNIISWIMVMSMIINTGIMEVHAENEDNGLQDNIHNHSWLYMADDNADIITATCEGGEGCDGTVLSLHVLAEDKEYNGESYSGLTIEGMDEWTTAGAGEPVVIYTSTAESSAESSDAPTEVGEYKVIVGVGEKTVEVGFVINQPTSLQQQEGITISEDVEPINTSTTTHTCSQCSCTTNNSFQSLTADTSLVDGGKYYLADNLTVENVFEISGKSVEICLNGKTLTHEGGSSIFYVSNGGTLTIHDCQGDGILTGGTGNTKHSYGSPRGGAVYLRHATLNLYGGTITGNTAQWGGAIFIDGSDLNNNQQLDDNEKSTFNMYGGIIKGNTAQYGGGGIEVENDGSIFNMHGGQIVENKVKELESGMHKGAGVHFNKGSFKIHGAVKIEGNYVELDNKENNVYLRAGKTITIPEGITLPTSTKIGISSFKIEKGSGEEKATSGYNENNLNEKFFLDSTHSDKEYALVHKSNELYIIKLPIKIVTNPESVAVNVGENATFRAAAEEGCSYQWQVDTNNSGIFTNIEGATGTTYTISNVTNAYNGYKYRCEFTKESSVVYSGVATLTVMQNVTPTPSPAPGPEPQPMPEIQPEPQPTPGTKPETQPVTEPTQTPEATPSSGNAEITVPVSREETDNVVHIKATISGETASVRALTTEELNKVAKNETETKSIEINLAETGSTIKEAVLPVSSLNEIARIMDDPNNKLEDITIKLSTATVEVSEHTLKAVLSKTNGSDLRLVVDDVHQDTLNDTQKEAVKNQNVHQCIDAYFISNGVRIGDFQGGTATIRLPFEVPAGLNGNGFSVWYVGDDGTIEKHATKYVNGELVFTVSHFSDYVVVYDGAVKDDVPKTGESADFTTILWTTVFMIGVVGLVANRQKKRQ